MEFIQTVMILQFSRCFSPAITATASRFHILKLECLASQCVCLKLSPELRVSSKPCRGGIYSLLSTAVYKTHCSSCLARCSGNLCKFGMQKITLTLQTKRKTLHQGSQSSMWHVCVVMKAAAEYSQIKQELCDKAWHLGIICNGVTSGKVSCRFKYNRMQECMLTK